MYFDGLAKRTRATVPFLSYAAAEMDACRIPARRNANRTNDGAHQKIVSALFSSAVVNDDNVGKIGEALLPKAELMADERAARKMRISVR